MRYENTLFLTHKDDMFKAFVNFLKLVQNVFSLKIISLRSDHGGEFVNHQFQICTENGISHNFSRPRTSQKMVLLSVKTKFYNNSLRPWYVK